MPVNFRWGENHNYIKLRKAKEFLDELRGLRMIIGIPTLMQLGAQIDLGAKQIRFSELGRTIDLEPVDILVARLGNRPISVLSMAGGGEFVYLAMKDAGIKVSRYDAVEIDPAARQLAKLLVPGIKHLKPHDVTKLPDDYLCQQGNNYELADRPMPRFQCAAD